MAISQIVAKLGDQLVTLEYNETTGRYEGYLTPQTTSYHQPGGYFPVAIKAESDSGYIIGADGEYDPRLRLKVLELAAPTLRIVSPEPGFLATPDPVVVFEAIDEEGGSGIDPDTFSLDGAAVDEIPGGYRYTWTPPDPWEDGPHTLTASVSDYDGNVSAASGTWVVDTIPPELCIKTPYMRHVVDTESITVSGWVSDTGSGAESVWAYAGLRHKTTPDETGWFSMEIPLDVGENNIPIFAKDRAGNKVREDLYMIRLITDRTKADIDKLLYLYNKPVTQWTDEENKWFSTGLLRGGYSVRDMNRVGVAVKFLEEELRKRGYAPNVSPKTDWTSYDAPTRTQGETYRRNVEAIRDAQGLEGLSEWPIPYTLRMLNYEGANQLEKALVQTDAIFPRYTAWTSGEVSCGE